MNSYVQIVTFKLKPASSRQLFVELTEQMVAANARNGLTAFLATDVANKMRAPVESDYQSFFGEAVVMLKAEKGIRLAGCEQE